MSLNFEDFLSFIAFVIAVAVWSILDRSNLEKHLKVHLWALAFIALDCLLVFGFFFVFKEGDSYGYISLFFGSLITVIIWLFFLKKYLKIRIRALPFVLLLPFLYVCMYLQAMHIFNNLDLILK